MQIVKLYEEKGDFTLLTKRILDLNKDKVNIMARIAGIDIPKNKRGVISRTYLYLRYWEIAGLQEILDKS